MAVVSDLMSVEAPLVVVDVARADAFGDRDNLVCFVGGDEEAVAEARPVLEAIAGTVQETGGRALRSSRAPRTRCRRRRR